RLQQRRRRVQKRNTEISKRIEIRWVRALKWQDLRGGRPFPGRDGLRAVPFFLLPTRKQGRFLEIAGIDHYLLFSDVGALSRHLIEKMAWCRDAEAKAKLPSEQSRQVTPPDFVQIWAVNFFVSVSQRKHRPPVAAPSK